MNPVTKNNGASRIAETQCFIVPFSCISFRACLRKIFGKVDIFTEQNGGVKSRNYEGSINRGGRCCWSPIKQHRSGRSVHCASNHSLPLCAALLIGPWLNAGKFIIQISGKVRPLSKAIRPYISPLTE